MAIDDSAELVPTRLVDVDALARALETFATDRDWVRFHSPKNLVMALTGEVGELSELFQWMPEDASGSAASDPRLAEPLRDELADVLDEDTIAELVALAKSLDEEQQRATRGPAGPARLGPVEPQWPGADASAAVACAVPPGCPAPVQSSPRGATRRPGQRRRPPVA